MKIHLLTAGVLGSTLLWGSLGCVAEEYVEADGDEALQSVLSTTVYQAESCTSEHGCPVVTNRAGYTGSGFRDYGKKDTWIEWSNVNAFVAGDHKLTFRYAVASGSRQCAVLINGKNVGNVPFSSTGSWKTWKTASITQPLRAGNNTIRVLANTDSGGPNLDKMELVAVDLCPENPKKTAPGLCGCLVPEGSCGGSGARPLDRAGGTKLRIGSWNTFRGSVFPKTDTVWKAINTSGRYHTSRTEAAARIFKAVDADVWLLQETVYSSADLPKGVTKDTINSRIASYMQSVTGDSWKVNCNAEGLCVMVQGNIRFDGTWEKGGSVLGNRAILRDNTRMLLVSVHYMEVDHANNTRDLVNSVGSSVSAVFVAGDFNDVPGGPRYKVIDGIDGMNNIGMQHWMDPTARHLSSSVASKRYSNTKGYVKFGTPGQVTYVGGGHIDHFFLKGNSWSSGNHFTLNTLLFSPQTLKNHGLTPLDVALLPQFYQEYFKNFLTNGVVTEILAYDSDQGIDHDHLPMIVDLTWP